MTLNWNSISTVTYRVEFKPDLNVTNWNELTGDVTATVATATKDDFVTTSNR